MSIAAGGQEVPSLPCLCTHDPYGPDVPPLVLPPAVIDVEDDVPEPTPQIGDRILVLREEWLRLILDGKKTQEIRNRKTRRGLVWLGLNGKVYGQVEITEVKDLTEEEFRRCGDAHLWPEDRPVPYKRICGYTLANLKVLSQPLPYYRPDSPIGWGRFRLSASDELPQSAAARKRAGEHQGNMKLKVKKEAVAKDAFPRGQGGAREHDC